jgi:hypothetical protein
MGPSLAGGDRSSAWNLEQHQGDIVLVLAVRQLRGAKEGVRRKLKVREAAGRGDGRGAHAEERGW